MELKDIEAVIEALLFTYGDLLHIDRICEIIEVDKKTTKSIMNNLMQSWQNSGRGLIIREINEGYQFCTRPEHFDYLKKLFEPRQKQGLSQAAYETLAIIAYNQPITRAKIEMIRGVGSDSSINKLIDRGLIKEAGRLDAPGKPILYETTEEFLRSFGYKSLGDMPVLNMLEINTD